jgi:ketosteroid isomerase-like protein
MHPNEERFRAGYDAFLRGDMNGVRELLAEDVVWHQPGNNPFSGDHRGIDEVLGLFMRLVEATGGTFRPEPHDILANDEHGVALITLTAERNGKAITDKETHVVHFRDGKVAESWIQLGDAYLELDPFFS